MRFYKYHGCGNDFILIDESPSADYRSLAVRMCDRRFGIGGDGLLVCSDYPPSMRIFNRDGSEASMCGNGIRCAAKHFAENGTATAGEPFCISTLDGPKTVCVGEDGKVYVEMGRARFDAENFGREYEIYGMKFYFYPVFIGCAHAVVLCGDIYRGILYGVGERLCKSELFPQMVNVDLVRVDSRSELTARTYERGAGYTAACGTGACAAYAVTRRLNLCDDEVRVDFEPGTLYVSGGEKIRLSGESEKVFCGEWEERS